MKHQGGSDDLDAETLQDLRADFDALDKDGSGTLDLDELKGF